jgi:subtilisin family serine protease
MSPLRSICAAIAALGCVASVQAADYVLQAAAWGPAQDAAVAAAGGSVRFSHREGVAVVASERTDFLAAVLAGGAVRSGARDVQVQAAPVRVVDAGVAADALPPVVDTFFAYVQWAPQAIKAPQAWAAGFTGKGVRVAVIDGGIYGDHADLSANIDKAAARSFAVSNVPGVGGCAATQWDCDVGTFWHGTHVAGIVAAPINGIGVVGIAPEATIVPVKALHNGSGSFGAVLLAILYAATDGRADIINMSLGAALPRGGGNPDARDVAELVSIHNRVVNFASRQGVLVISSAGNDGLDYDHQASLYKVPAESGNGLAVSATGPLGYALGATNFARPASYSSYGSSLVTLAAPGGDFALEGEAPCTLPLVPAGTITRPCWVFDMVFSTARGTSAAGGLSWAAGTSMAAPATSAVAALIKQKYPGLSVGALKTRLERATDDAGKPGNDSFYGRGFLNAAKAVSD